MTLKVIPTMLIKHDEQKESVILLVETGKQQGPYEFKPAMSSSSANNNVFSPLNIFPQSTLDKPIKGSFILQE
ncbi:hypothetical protein YC2023_031983 [Brassica napus]